MRGWDQGQVCTTVRKLKGLVGGRLGLSCVLILILVFILIKIMKGFQKKRKYHFLMDKCFTHFQTLRDRIAFCLVEGLFKDFFLIFGVT